MDKELIELMRNEKFELCYALGYNKYLAPQLLPVEMPSSVHELEVSNEMHFRIKYKFMPKGIISRLIVKNHEYIYNQNKWRYGLIMIYKSTFAIIKENYFNNEIEITLFGSNCVILLELIRKSINEIHASFNGKLDFDELISCVCNICKDSDSQSFHSLRELEERKNKEIKFIECRLSYELVSVKDLLKNIVINKTKVLEDIYRETSTKKIFVSYSKHDTDYLEEFNDHLITLKDEGLIETFNCSAIDFGEEWDDKIKEEIRDCNIMICLISAKFLNTEYIKKIEIPTAIRMQKMIIPIIIKACDWENSMLGKYQAAQRGKIVSLDNQLLLKNRIKSYSDEERAAFWTLVVKELRAKVFSN
jgi:hypothetical protein